MVTGCSRAGPPWALNAGVLLLEHAPLLLRHGPLLLKQLLLLIKKLHEEAHVVGTTCAFGVKRFDRAHLNSGVSAGQEIIVPKVSLEFLAQHTQITTDRFTPGHAK